MDKPFLNPITERYTDRSNAKSFAFSFYCDQCGKEWRSASYALRTGGMRLPMNPRVAGMLRNNRHKTAYEKANLEAINEFYYCSECGRRVCAECFCQSETDTAEVCKSCLLQRQADN